MAPATFRITGRTIDSNTNQGIAGIRIEVWDKDLFFDDFVGSALSDSQGRLRVTFDEQHFMELIERRPDIYFKVFQNDQLIPAAQIEIAVTLPDGRRLSGRGDQVYWQLAPGETLVGVKLVLPAGETIYSVRGRVTEPDGSPIAGVAVRVFDISLQDETLLGEVTTGEDGAYLFTYQSAAFLDQGKSAPDLDIRVFDAQGKKISWLVNPPLLNARLSETINLVRGAKTYVGPSDFQRRVDALRPILSDVNLASLEPSQLAYLVKKSGQNAQQVVQLARAAHMADFTQQPAEVFYALFGLGLPQALPALIRQSPEVVRQALREAVARNLVPERDADQQADALMASFKNGAVDLAMMGPSEEGRLSLGSLLATTLENEGLQRRFLDVYANHSGSIESFWESLEADPELGGAVGALQLTMQLSALSLNHPPMLAHLQQMHLAGEFETLSDMVSFDETDWQQTITEGALGVPHNVPGADHTEKVRNYARVMSDKVEDAFPTAFLVQRLSDGELKDFLVSHPDFSLKSNPVGRYLHEHNISYLTEETVSQLRAMQRVYRIAPRQRAMKTLLADGLDSAYRISRVGKNVFMDRYVPLLGASEARCAYERAHQVHAMGLLLLAKAGLIAPSVGAAVYKDETTTDIPEIPEWQTLFQNSLKLCACRHCRSLLSPAAYLVDVLHFLSERPATDNERHAIDILFERRSDLARIELSCDNTNIPVPYVDLVNEILEDTVAQPTDFAEFELDSDLEADLNNHTVSDALLGVFAEYNCPLEFAVIAVGSENQGRTPLQPWWTIDDIRFTYHIRKQNGDLKVVSRSRQTKGSAAERAAMPQYLNPAAYEQLRSQVYPWALPFDLDWETIGIYLSHLGTSRAEILEAFRLKEPGEVIGNTELAFETLGLSAAEADIIQGVTTNQAGAASPGPWNLWGFAKETLDGEHGIPDPVGGALPIISGNWLEVLAGRADVFLQQSGLTYRQMLDLLGTYFINPVAEGERQIHLISLDPDRPDTCETCCLALEGLEEDEAAALRMVRFVRLWRRLGWTMHDLDRAITALGPEDLDSGFLINLSHIVRLQKRLRLPARRLLAFWANLDIAVYIDHDAAGQPSQPSLYHELFRDPSVIKLPNPDFPSDPSDLSGLLSDCEPAIATALGISTTDLTLLLADDKVLAQADQDLNIANLSALYRHAALAKALKLKVGEYLSLLALQADDIFASPLNTFLFIKEVALIENSGFSILQIDYLLRHTAASVEALDPAAETIIGALEALRAGLQTIAAENTYRKPPADPADITVDLSNITMDPDGDLTHQKLALLNWDPKRIDMIIAILNGTAGYEADLAALPDGFKFPDEVKEKVTFDAAHGALTFRGVMSETEYQQLKTLLPNDESYKTAIDTLFIAPRDFLKRNLRAFSVPDLKYEGLDSLPDGLIFPDDLKEKIYYDAVGKVLHFRGVMTAEERDILFNLAVNFNADALGDAVNALFDMLAPDNWSPVSDDTFLALDEIENLVDDDFGAQKAPAQRFGELLNKLLPHLKTTLGRRLICHELGEALGLETTIISRLLTDWLTWTLPGDPPASGHLITVFEAPAFAESNPHLPITQEAFGEQFKSFVLLHKVAMVVTTIELSMVQLEWLFEFHDNPWPDLNTMPVEAESANSIDLAPWKHLWRLHRLRNSLSNGEALLDDIFKLAWKGADGDKETIHQRLSTALGWSATDLDALLEPQEPELPNFVFPDDYQGEQWLCRLQECFRLLKRLGVSGRICGHLCGPLHDAHDPGRGRHIANQVVQAVRARYDDERWFSIAKPMRDAMRERQRSALVDSLVAYPQGNRSWRDINDLYAYFLIDPEMNPCMMTSRIQQAHGTVQLFVQRCLMNLEPQISASDTDDQHWRQWRWMKNYRVWEANRKVFLYPENWIEPELRDDKSPFFEELESELMQGNVTLESAAQAMMGYLDKLDQVARLEIVGQYHQVEKVRDGNVAVDVLHVFGRTPVAPHVYYYRRRMDSYLWTPWERVDVDIEGDHLMPVVWNRRLFLYWPIFSEKSKEAVKGSGKKLTDVTTAEIVPEKIWEIKLAWSEYNNGKWAAKQTSSAAATIPIVDNLTNCKEELLFRHMISADPADAGALEIFVLWNVNVPLTFYNELSSSYMANKCNSILNLVAMVKGCLDILKVGITEQTQTELEELLDAIINSTLDIAWHLGQMTTIQVSTELIEHCNNICTEAETIMDKAGKTETYSGTISVELWNSNDADVFRQWIKALEYSSNIAATARWILVDANNLIQSIKGESDVPCFKFGAAGRKDPKVFYASIYNVWEQIAKQQIYGTRLTGAGLQCLPSEESLCEDLFLPVPEDTKALANVPGGFCLIPRGDGESLHTAPFFYMDADRTFFVQPYPIEVPLEWSNGYQIDPGTLPNIANAYTESLWGIDFSGGQASDPYDPPYQEPSIPDERSDDPGQDIRQRPAARAKSSIAGKFSSTRDTWTINSISSVGMVLFEDLSVDVTEQNQWWNVWRTEYRYQFQTFYHPFVSKFVWQLRRDGLAGLLQRTLQSTPKSQDFVQPGDRWLNFEDDYTPTEIVEAPYPADDMHFENDNAYALYNWELFFHAPLLIAERLKQNQRFEEAQQWLHYIFDPTERSGLPAPKRYWKTKPFFERSEEDYQKQYIVHILELLAKGTTSDPVEQKELSELNHSVGQWRQDPFKPHLIARLRTLVYQKTVVMKYIDNLIAWGDQLFRRDTIESINEATQLYILAAEILGRKPEDTPPRVSSGAQTFESLQSKLGDFSNALVAIEEFIPPSAGACQVHLEDCPNPTPVMYFCAPRNEKLLGYWDIVADRLFKIRHCMNIEGMVRQLPLFQPPIDPALLVRAAAAGVDMGSLLSDITGATPFYRFAVMVQKAGEVCAELKSLGAGLLNTLEKRDAEALAQMRGHHETVLLELIEAVKKQQIEEAEQNLTALRRTRDLAVARYLHYQKLLGVQSPQVPAEGQPIPEQAPSPHVSINEEGGAKMIPLEKQVLALEDQAHGFQQISSSIDLAANYAHILPNINLEPYGIGTTFGGSNIGQALTMYANFFRNMASDKNFAASRTGKLVQYTWRAHDWSLQSNLAAKEIMQIDAQIIAAQIREALAERELENHCRQIEQAEAVEAFMRDKYTNEALYGWMGGQISGLYFLTYQLAYDLAKRAERTFRQELGLEDSDFIRFGYWDSLKKGLLAGEKLALDIKRMEVAYHEKNRREYELTKHVSLSQVDPLALMQLREIGNCTVSLPEALFDMDCPGHYFRRIKHVAVSIPCVTGPFTSLNCKLTLLKSSIRRSPVVSDGDGYVRAGSEDGRFLDAFGSLESIVASSGNQDSGLFEANLRDERYLPFEGAGTISEWRLELPAEWRQFDYDTISDVILHFRYTAREGGELLRTSATEYLSTLIENAKAAGSPRLFSIRHEFPTEWAQFKAISSAETSSFPLSIQLREAHYPFWSQGRLGDITSAELFARPTVSGEVIGIAYDPDDDAFENLGDALGQLCTGSLSQLPDSPTGEYTLYFNTNGIDDLWLALAWGDGE